MRCKTFFVQTEHKSETKFKFLRLDEVTFTPDDETTSGNEHTRRRSFAYLRSIHPINLCEHFRLPAGTMTHLECCCLHQWQGGDRQSAGVFQNAHSSSVQLTVHEQIVLVHVTFHKRLILLRIPAANNQVVFRGHEPDKFLKPEYLAV